MIFATALPGDHAELRETCVGTQKLTIVCEHGLLRTWCGICTEKPKAMTEPVVDFLGDGCLVCKKTIVRVGKTGPLPSYCPEHNKNRNGSRNRWQHFVDLIKDANTTLSTSVLRRFKYMSFDGRYEGPTNLCFTVVSGLRFDRGFKAMPIDVHVKPREPKFTQVTPEDSEWDFRQSSAYSRWATAGDGARTAYPPSRRITEPHTNFCPHCSGEEVGQVTMTLKREYWIEKGRMVHEDKVVPQRVMLTTRGKYVLQGHVCNV